MALVAIGVAGAGATAGVAAAAPRTVAAGPVVDVIGPRLAGSSLLWGERRSGYQVRRAEQARVVLREAKLDSARPVETVPGSTLRGLDAGALQVHLAGSAFGALVRTRQYFEGNRYVPPQSRDGGTLQVLPTARTLVAACPLTSSSCPLAAIDVDGDHAVVSGPGPEPNGTVLGLADGSRRALALPGENEQDPSGVVSRGRGQNLRIAGPYVATVEGTDIVVFDWMAGTERYRLRGIVKGFAQPSVDIQADGVAVVAPDTSQPSQPFWASPAAPTPHPIPIASRRSYQLLIDRGRIVFTRSIGRGQYELGTSLLDGSERTLVRPALASEDNDERLFDFDGRRIAWAERDCNGQRMAVAGIDELTARPRIPRPLRCRLGLERPPTLVGDRFEIYLSCTGLRRYCSASRLTIRAARTYRRGRLVVHRGTLLANPGSARIGGTFRTTTRAGERLGRISRRPLVTVDAQMTEGLGTFRQHRTVRIRAGRKITGDGSP